MLREGEVAGRRRDRQGATGPGADDRRRRSTRCSTCPGTTAPRCAARAAHPGAEPGLAGLVPGACSTPTGRHRQRRLTAAEPPPPAWPGFRPLGSPRRPGERHGDLVAWLSPDGEPLPAALPGQFLTLRLHRRRRRRGRCCAATRCPARPAQPDVPDQRQARAARRRSAASSTRTCAPATWSRWPRRVALHPARRATAPVLLIVRRASAPRRCWRCCTRSPPAGPTREIWWLHGARNRAEHAVRRRGPRPCSPRLPDARTAICYSAPAARPTGSERDYDRPRPPRPRRARRARPAARRGRLPLRAGAVHGRHDRRPWPTLGLDPAQHPHRDLRRRRRDHPGHRRRPGRRAASARRRRRAPGRRSPSPAAASPCRGGTTYASLLELAEACDVPTRWSCRTGVCHTCETGLLGGAVTYDPRRSTLRRRQRPDLLRGARRRRRPRPLTRRLAVRLRCARRLPMGRGTEREGAHHEPHHDHTAGE